MQYVKLFRPTDFQYSYKCFSIPLPDWGVADSGNAKGGDESPPDFGAAGMLDDRFSDEFKSGFD